MTSKNQSGLIAACRRFLPEIVKMTLAADIDCKNFIDLVKDAYVGVATAECGRGNMPASISQVSRVTGLTRIDVRRIKDRQPAPDPTRVSDERRHKFTTLLRDWHNDTLLTDTEARPLPLRATGPGATFESLSRRYFKDEPVQSLLNELKRVGAVEIKGKDTVVVVRDYYMPRVGSEEYAERIGGVVADFLRCVAYNYTRETGDDSRIEMRTTETEFPVKMIPDFTNRLETEATAMYQRLEAWLKKTAEQHADGPMPKERVGFGVYQIEGE